MPSRIQRTPARSAVRPTVRRGFTLVELLVVIAIIGILVALLLPAVQAAREAARRVQCSNHMKQLGLAMLQYVENTGNYPPAKIKASGIEHNWMPCILPFIEQQNLHDTYQWDVSWNHTNNQQAINTPLPFAQCPSSIGDYSRAIDVGSGRTGAVGEYSVTDTVKNKLIQVGIVPPTTTQSGYDGPLQQNLYLSPALTRDGTSNTLLIVEISGRPQHWTAEGQGPDRTRYSCSNHNVVGGIVRGGAWADSTNKLPLDGISKDGAICPSACAFNCSNNNEAFSFHNGGMMVVFADGHVIFLNESIEIAIYAALISRDGGETIDGSKL